MMEKLAFLLLLFIAVSAQKYPEWDYKTEARKVNMRGCSNLTTVLDNWKFAIMTQIKDLLLYDHQTVLPDYGRIHTLSEALDDLYKEFNALKERMIELTNKFETVELFVDEMKASRQTVRNGGRRVQSVNEDGLRKRRVVIRKVKKPLITNAN
uniref:Si:ch73-127m5.3 n=1 Tax=Callorhinchus milii TaxID=7868 RepID=V9L096_CALMI